LKISASQSALKPYVEGGRQGRKRQPREKNPAQNTIAGGTDHADFKLGVGLGVLSVFCERKRPRTSPGRAGGESRKIIFQYNVPALGVHIIFSPTSGVEWASDPKRRKEWPASKLIKEMSDVEPIKPCKTNSSARTGLLSYVP